MQWEEYYDKIEEWATSTAVSRMSQLTSFGPPDEIVDVINTIGCVDEKGAVRLLKKATAAGVKFSGEQLSDFCLFCDKEALNRAIVFSSDRFTAEDLEALYCNCEDALLIEIARKRGLQLPEDLVDYEDTENEPPAVEKVEPRNRAGFCPDCGRPVASNFCPDCGCDLRKIPVSKPAAMGITEDYAQYLRFYPNKLEAIRALRVDTGMSLAEAYETINVLFGVDTRPEKPVFKQDTEWKKVSAAENRRKSYAEAERQKKARNTAKTIGKGVGLAAFFGGYGIFRILSGLVKPYMGKRR